MTLKVERIELGGGYSIRVGPNYYGSYPVKAGDSDDAIYFSTPHEGSRGISVEAARELAAPVSSVR